MKFEKVMPLDGEFCQEDWQCGEYRVQLWTYAFNQQRVMVCRDEIHSGVGHCEFIAPQL